MFAETQDSSHDVPHAMLASEEKISHPAPPSNVGHPPRLSVAAGAHIVVLPVPIVPTPIMSLRKVFSQIGMWIIGVIQQDHNLPPPVPSIPIVVIETIHMCHVCNSRTNVTIVITDACPVFWVVPDKPVHIPLLVVVTGPSPTTARWPHRKLKMFSIG